MRRFEHYLLTVQESRRASNAGGGVIRASVPEGQGGATHPLGSANAGTLSGLPMG